MTSLAENPPAQAVNYPAAEDAVAEDAVSEAPPVHDLRLVPLALAAWAATWLGTLSTPGALASGAVAAVVTAVCAILRRSVRLTAVALVLLAGLGVGAAHHHRLSSGPVATLASSEAVVAVEAVLKSDPHITRATGPRPAYLTARVDVSRVAGRGTAWRVRSPVLLTVSGGPQITGWSKVSVGTRLATTGRLQAPEAGSDFAALLRVRGLPSIRSPPSPGLQLVERVRQGLRESVSRRRPEPRALVPGLVLGDTSAMTAELTDDFKTTGLTHLTAVSGANLSLLLAFMLLTARWLGVRGWWLRAVGLLGVAVFVGLCRTEPSVLRAAAMGLVALAALGTGGSRKGIRSLAVAMLVLLMVDPYLSRSLGFALSVLASGGIVWWAGSWAAILSAWMPRIVAESMTVPLAAHLTTLPVVASISGRVSVVGVLANAAAGPFVGPATVLGFAAAGLSLVSPSLAAVVGFGAAWSAQLILWVAHAGASLPGAAWHWPATPVSLTILAAIAGLIGYGMPHLLTRRWLCLVMACVLVLACVRAPVQPGWPPQGWIFVACDVGQGDGLVVRVADGQAVVIDTGPDPAPMQRCLDQLGIKQVPVLVLTHFHADHVAGVEGVAAHRSIGEILVSPLPQPAFEASSVYEFARLRGIPLRVPSVGERLQVGEASWEMVWPLSSQPPAGGAAADPNESSLVLLMTVRGVRILFTGEVGPDGQHVLLTGGADLRADVLKVPHHGSARQDPDFLAATHARLAIVSVGLHNDYGHPAPRTVRLVHSLGMTLLRTDVNGSVAVTVKKGSLGAATQQ